MNTDLKNISSGKDLHEAILLLEGRQEDEGKVLRDHFMRTYESMRPVNLIKSAFNEVTESQELKDHLLSSGVGLVAGHVSKRVYDGVQGNANGSITGTAIQFGVTNIVARHPEVLIAAGRGIFRLAYAAWKQRGQGAEETV